MAGTAEIDHIRSRVEHYFPVYETLVSHASITFFITPDQDALEERFDALRREFKGMDLIPAMRYSGGEYQLVVTRRPPIRRKGIIVNEIMLVVTFATTVLAGAVLWASYQGEGELLLLDNFLWGAVYFALPLLAILGTHELSHYLMAKRHGVEASLPFFIPSIPPLGTFGAFISIREPMPDRKALMDIGIAGPIGGLLVTLPVTLIGLFLTSQGDPASGAVGDEGAMMIMLQPIFEMFLLFIPLPENVALHPTAFAAWVGFLVTAINLLPAGQLDGGHVARAVLGDKARYLSFATAGLLVLLSFIYTGWLLFALLIILLGLRHPPPLNDISRLGGRRVAVGALALVILATTFLPVPIMTVESDHSFHAAVVGNNSTSVTAGEAATFYILLENTGNTDVDLALSLSGLPAHWGSALYVDDGGLAVSDDLEVPLDYEDNVTVTVQVEVPTDALETAYIGVMIDSQDTEREVDLTINVL